MKTTSVVVCTYNGARYLKEQIDSILRQTISPNEIIIQDDASTDKTFEILIEYQSLYPFIKVYKNEKNLGFKENFFSVIKKTSCDYIALADQDDVWTDDHIETLINIIGKKDAACGNSLFVDENLKPLNSTMSEAQNIKQFPIKDVDRILPILYNNNYCQGTCMLARKELLLSIFPIPENIKYHDIWIALSACVNNGIIYTNKIINNYRQHSKSITPIYSKGIGSVDFFHFHHKVYGHGCEHVSEELFSHYNIPENSTLFTILKEFEWYSKHCKKIMYRIPCAYIRFKRYKSIYMTTSLSLFIPRLVHWLFSFTR